MIIQAKGWVVPDADMEQLALDLITTAVEGGINYWATVEDYDCDKGTVVVYETEYLDTEDEVRYSVDPTEMLNAIRTVLGHEVKPFGALGYAQSFTTRLTALLNQLQASVPYLEADFDYDASDADCMMQVALLGEVIYG